MVFNKSYIVLPLVLVAAPMTALSDDSLAIPAPAVQVGDSWVYKDTSHRGVNGFSEHITDESIERVGPDSMVVGVKPDGSPGAYVDHIVGLDWSKRHLVDGQSVATTRPFSFPLMVGKAWTDDYDAPQNPPLTGVAHFHRAYKIAGWEDVTVPAGTFRALKIVYNGSVDAKVYVPNTVVGGIASGSSGSTTFTHSQKAASGPLHFVNYGEVYYVPELKYAAKFIDEQYNSESVLVRRDVSELVSFKAAAH